MRLAAKINNRSLENAVKSVVVQVMKSREGAENIIKAAQDEIVSKAKSTSMVATGQTRGNIQNFGSEEISEGTVFSVGIMPGAGSQELFTEDILYTKHKGVHTSVDEHVKNNCSRAVVGDNPDPSVYDENPAAERQSFRKAIVRETGFDVEPRRDGAMYRYVSYGMAQLSQIYTKIRAVFT